MRAICEPERSAPDWPPAKGQALFIGTLLAALLGLTLLDVAPPRSGLRQHAAADESIDCIVASAIFAGVSVDEPVRSP